MNDKQLRVLEELKKGTDSALGEARLLVEVESLRLNRDAFIKSMSVRIRWMVRVSYACMLITAALYALQFILE